MSRIMHCIASLRIGGVEKRVVDSLRYFAERGSTHQHVLCAFKGGELEETAVPELRDKGIACHVLQRSSRYSRAFRRSLRDVAGSVQPDIVHAYNQTAGRWARMVLGRDSRWKIIMHCGGSGGLQWRWRMLERLMLSRTSAFVFNSLATRTVWEKHLSIRCPKRVVYNGVDVSARDADDELYRLPTSPFCLLTVCRVVAIKSLPTQLRALKILHDRGQTDVRLIVVGDGPQLGLLKSEAEQLGISEAVTFEGYQADPRRYHRQAHVYLCTSYNETFSMTLAEAMLSGMVCISASVGGPSEIIEDSRNGFLVPCTEPVPAELRGTLPQGQTLPSTVYDNQTSTIRAPLGVSPDALADRIAEVRENYEQLGELRLAARRRIVDRFSVGQYVRSLEALYDDLGDGKDAHG
jgi:glycosyltransferase involved in cell wall biosynthesis